MQWLPASLTSPRSAVHFGLLRAMQDMKLIAQVSVLAWVSMLNMREKREAKEVHNREIICRAKVHLMIVTGDMPAVAQIAHTTVVQRLVDLVAEYAK